MSVRTGPKPLPSGSVSRFFHGFGYAFEAVDVIRQQRLWLLTAIPIAVNVALFLVMLAVTFWLVLPWLGALEQALVPAVATGFWNTVVAGLAKILVWGLWLVTPLLLLFVNAFVVVVVGQAVAGPFLDLLSERVECVVLGVPPAPTSVPRILRSIRTALADVVWSLLYWLGAQIPLLLLSLIPVLGSVSAAVLSFAFTSLLLAVEFVGLSLTRYFVGYRQRFGALWGNRAVGLGLGVATMAMLLIPGVNLLLLPVAAVAGTLLYVDLRGAGQLSGLVPELPQATTQPDAVN